MLGNKQLSRREAKEVKKLVTERELRPHAGSELIPIDVPPLRQQVCYACKVTTQITAFASGGPTPGTGVVSIYRIDETSGDLIEVDTGVTVYNMVNATVSTNTWGMIQSDNWGNLWFTVEDC